MTRPNLEEERAKDVSKIMDSKHPRKIVVAGPGTGKSHLFSEIIKKKRKEGKTRFLAITFIGKLGDALADDLCGLADTQTMHGFARGFVLSQMPKDWDYYPDISTIIAEDLKAEGIEEFSIGDENYKKKSQHYKIIGHDDAVLYAVKICEKDSKKIPQFDIILIDEYQDFNEVESRFVDLLASKNEVVIVGDDDQALYEFKGSSPAFIREKHAAANKEFESHSLRFCSRCPEVIIKYFHKLVEAYKLNDPAKKRIQKDYVCYTPDKEGDSKANPKIHLVSNCPPGMVAWKIEKELTNMQAQQKIKDVLVIGEGRTCDAMLRGIANQLKGSGFRYVDYQGEEPILPFRVDVIEAYKFLAEDEASVIGWRILKNPTEGRELHIKNAKRLAQVIDATPAKLRDLKFEDLEALELAIEHWEDGKTNEDHNKQVRKSVLATELKRANQFLSRPLCNLEITVCNILRSKGLGADIVFLVGFDAGKIPSKKEAMDSEVYQMLVALTRAKKRIYLVNTSGKAVSSFIDCLDKGDLEVENLNPK